jgi:anti-sigma regulatory factor (Ser/Thr protein kinase)
MTTDPSRGDRIPRIECTLHHDSRLMPGITAVVAHVARRAGLSEQAEASISAAAAEACREAFLLLDSQAGSPFSVKLIVADFADRVEVTIESPARALPATALDALRKGAAAKAGEGMGKPLEGNLVDRVERETRNGLSRVTLVKYCDAAKSRPKV